MKTFHERLAKAMQRASVNESMLALRTGIDVTNIYHLLGGRRNPSLGTLYKLLRAIPNVDARWLIMGDQNGRSKTRS